MTNTLSKVLTKLPFMKASKATAMTNRIAIDEMQLLLADYFRIKGAPKVRDFNEKFYMGCLQIHLIFQTV